MGLSNSIRLAIAICDHLDSSSGCLAPLKDPKDPVLKTSNTSLVVQTKHAGLSCDFKDYPACFNLFLDEILIYVHFLQNTIFAALQRKPCFAMILAKLELQISSEQLNFFCRGQFLAEVEVFEGLVGLLGTTGGGGSSGHHWWWA